jgi:hypothetical protein
MDQNFKQEFLKTLQSIGEDVILSECLDYFQYELKYLNNKIDDSTVPHLFNRSALNVHLADQEGQDKKTARITIDTRFPKSSFFYDHFYEKKEPFNNRFYEIDLYDLNFETIELVISYRFGKQFGHSHCETIRIDAKENIATLASFLVQINFEVSTHLGFLYCLDKVSKESLLHKFTRVELLETHTKDATENLHDEMFEKSIEFIYWCTRFLTEEQKDKREKAFRLWRQWFHQSQDQIVLEAQLNRFFRSG